MPAPTEPAAPADVAVELALASRSGLGDDIAYLRSRYPQADWRGHANFGQLADFWLHVHQSLRGEAATVQQVTQAFRGGTLSPPAFERAFVPGLNGFLGHLDAHHRIEDSVYFPKFRALDTRMARGFDVLEADHALIHATLVTTVEHARALLHALTTPDPSRAAHAFAETADGLLNLLVRHLADEEDLVIPAMLEHGERRLG